MNSRGVDGGKQPPTELGGGDPPLDLETRRYLDAGLAAGTWWLHHGLPPRGTPLRLADDFQPARDQPLPNAGSVVERQFVPVVVDPTHNVGNRSSGFSDPGNPVAVVTGCTPGLIDRDDLKARLASICREALRYLTRLKAKCAAQARHGRPSLRGSKRLGQVLPKEDGRTCAFDGQFVTRRTWGNDVPDLRTHGSHVPESRDRGAH